MIDLLSSLVIPCVDISFPILGCLSSLRYLVSIYFFSHTLLSSIPLLSGQYLFLFQLLYFSQVQRSTIIHLHCNFISLGVIGYRPISLLNHAFRCYSFNLSNAFYFVYTLFKQVYLVLLTFGRFRDVDIFSNTCC